MAKKVSKGAGSADNLDGDTNGAQPSHCIEEDSVSRANNYSKVMRSDERNVGQTAKKGQIGTIGSAFGSELCSQERLAHERNQPRVRTDDYMIERLNVGSLSIGNRRVSHDPNVS